MVLTQLLWSLQYDKITKKDVKWGKCYRSGAKGVTNLYPWRWTEQFWNSWAMANVVYWHICLWEGSFIMTYSKHLRLVINDRKNNLTKSELVYTNKLYTRQYINGTWIMYTCTSIKSSLIHEVSRIGHFTWFQNTSTVKPIYRGHPRDRKILTSMCRWPFCTG